MVEEGLRRKCADSKHKIWRGLMDWEKRKMMEMRRKMKVAVVRFVDHGGRA